MKGLKIVCTIGVIFSILAFIVPEDIVEVLNSRLYQFNKENPSTNLFLHLDKSVYSQNEDVWFKAYVLAGAVIDSKVLYVRLTNEKKQIMIAEQFPVYDIRSHGEILLPDTLKDGNYYLYAYTDRMINFKEEDIFVQNVRVQRNVAKRLQANASVTDTANIKRGQNIEVVIQLSEGIKLLKGIRGKYELIDDKTIIKSARITTNNFGEAFINFKYPQLADEKSLKVRAIFNRNSDYAELELNLRHETNPLKIKLFPEGGHLLPGFSSKVVVEALDINKYPVSTWLSLMENDRLIKRFKTDKYGTGSFLLKPSKNAIYTINYTDGKKSSASYPVLVEDKGYALSVVHQGDRLIASIKNHGEVENAVLVFRTIEDVLLAKSIVIPTGDSVVVPFVFKDIPKNVVSVFVLNEAGNVLCERLVLNKPGKEDYNVNIRTEQLSYGPRKKVIVNIEVKDSDGNPVTSNLSVAAVEKSRIDPEAYRTILSSYYYRFLDGTNCNRYIPATIEKDIDNLLITKHWLNSSTQYIANYTSIGPVHLIENTGGITGSVKSLYKRKFDLKNLTILSKEKGVIVPVNANGSFSIKPESLVSNRGNKWKMLQSLEFLQQYELKFNAFDLDFDKQITGGNALFIPNVFSAFASNKPVEVTKVGNVIQLKTVEIKGKGSPIDSYESRTVQTIGCDAYICRNNILNCPNHTGDGGIPEEGKVYASKNGPVVYRCRTKSDEMFIKNIIKPKDFQATDFEKEKIEELALETTVYWDPNFGTNASGKNTFSFFTNDAKGDFLIIAQGIDVKTLRPMFGKTGFTVK
ncbi:hypothetical protein WG906_02245 [Pedobacter sp. P351]|uniref:hypothetical protein n=1 Tax=Pedobacter superstes TaxID=3133441 RepID=UPI00309F1C00